VWVSGALLYGACYTWHVREVWAHPAPEHAVRASVWLHLGGVPFLLSAIRWTGWAFLLPSASLAVILALIVGGIVNPRGQIHVRVISATYAVLFLFVGQPFNNYWGLVAAPVWALAMVYGAQLVAHDCRVLSGISQDRGQM
jgi:formate hydrogenlyase subunit 3/multisubunit Na+/H+ antiporter MnhD subunit